MQSPPTPKRSRSIADRRRLLLVVLALLAVAVLAPTSPAFADQPHCDAVGATYDSTNDECDLDVAVTKTGLVPVGHTLHIGPSGKITVPLGQTLTLDIEGDLVMDAGAQIVSAAAIGSDVGGSTVVDASGDIVLHGTGTTGALISANGSPTTGGCSGGKAGNVTLMAGGDVTTEDGSQITANSKCPAGEIKILAPTGNIDIDGLVESRSTNTGTGAVQRPGGGPITITTGCNLTVSGTGVVSSSGLDPGADLVHVEAACEVRILGLVESTGHGHAVPNSPTNHCYYQVAGFPSPPQTPINALDDPQNPRADKSPNSTACVEVWAGKTLTIDRAGANGEVNADLSLGANGRSWIDLYAREDINVIGGAGTGDCNAGNTADLFAVHAKNGGNNPTGGQLTVKSTEGKLTASGFAFQADAGGSGFPDGGFMTLEAAKDVTFDSARVCVRGDFDPTGGYGNGGKIGNAATSTPGIRSYQGTFHWTGGIGDVRPTGTDPPPPPTLLVAGEIVYQDCTVGPVNTTGTSFPNNGAPATTPTELADQCGNAPTLPSYVALPVCLKQTGSITIVKDADPDDVQDFDFTGDLGAFKLDDDGDETDNPPSELPSSKDFNDLDPGTYEVNETPFPSGWKLTKLQCDDGSTTDTATGKATIVLTAGEHVTCTYTNTKLAKITIVKDADPNDAQDFDFGGDLGAFKLDDDGDETDNPPSDLPSSKDFGDLDPGDYDVTETPIPNGWSLDKLVCDDGSPTNTTTGKASISLAAGEHVTCTFTNTKKGKITIVKDAIPNDARDFDFGGDLGAFKLDDDGNETNNPPSNLPSSKDFNGLDPDDYDVTETPIPTGWGLDKIECDDGSPTNTTTGTASISLAAGEHVTCTFTNKKTTVTVHKTTNGVVNPSFTWTFTLKGTGVNVTDTTAADGTVDFNNPVLAPGTYTVCEINVPVGFTSTWKLDGNSVTPFNPDASNIPPEDLGNRCYTFTVTAGQTRTFDIDNTRPGGDTRTIGYWKNWNRCTKGNQAATADKNGGAAAGFFLVENFLPKLIGDYNVDTCLKAVRILSKQDKNGSSKASDAAYGLAAQLLAAKFNVAAGAETCTAAQTAITSGQALLDAINFTGSGGYLDSKSKSPNRATALSLASQLDKYNNGILCP